jgi:dienelactone hydrolase
MCNKSEYINDLATIQTTTYMKKRTLIIGISAIAILVISYFIIDNILFTGIRPESIDQDGIKGNYYAAPNTEKKAAVLLVGGGQWGDYWGSELVKRGSVGLSLPYTRLDGLPELPEEIPLEYFQKALIWLSKQPEVDPNKMVVMGASRNAELALLIASHYPEIVSGAVAYSPSSVSWSNTVLPFNSDDLKASWTYKGEDIPYIPMEKIAGSESTTINTMEYWTGGLNNKPYLDDASIKVERINGPILLLSGKDDEVWPSSLMADMIEERLKQFNLSENVHNIQYVDAGHLISGNPESIDEARTGKMNIQGKEYDYRYGGTREGDFKAKQDAKKRVFELISNI